MQNSGFVCASVTDVSKSATKQQQQSGFLVPLPGLQLAFKPSYDLERWHLLWDVCL